MKPYTTIKLTENPDVGDIREQGRKSSVGKLKNGRGYSAGPSKKTTRRNLKRADRQAVDRQVANENISNS